MDKRLIFKTSVLDGLKTVTTVVYFEIGSKNLRIKSQEPAVICLYNL